MQKMSKLSTAFVLIALSTIVGVSSVRADSAATINSVNVNFSPIVTTISYNYDFLTGTLTPGTATATALAVNGVFMTKTNDPNPPGNQGSGTFIGVARPINFQGDEVVYLQSSCPSGYPNCFSDGSFTFGVFVMRKAKGDTLDQLTNLAANWNVQAGCDGGGAPRFAVDLSNGATISVYFGSPPNYSTDCAPSSSTWMSTGNLATDPPGPGGTRWDSTQIGGTFYGTYSQAVALANAQGLTISDVAVIIDGGWSGTNPSTTQTILFQQIQVNGVTRFP